MGDNFGDGESRERTVHKVSLDSDTKTEPWGEERPGAICIQSKE